MIGKSYQYGDIDAENESPSQARYGGFLRTPVLVGLATVLVVFGVATSLGSYVSPAPKTLMEQGELAVEGSAKEGPRACTFTECYATGCDKATAPYNCVHNNGGPHGGCSAYPWEPGTCDDQCDLSGCDALDIPMDVESCVGAPCSKDWCTVGQLCPDNVPYQCVSGAARFGCSTDSFHWPLRVGPGTCNECCDVTTC